VDSVKILKSKQQPYYKEFIAPLIAEYYNTQDQRKLSSREARTFLSQYINTGEVEQTWIHEILSKSNSIVNGTREENASRILALTKALEDFGHACKINIIDQDEARKIQVMQTVRGIKQKFELFLCRKTILKLCSKLCRKAMSLKSSSESSRDKNWQLRGIHLFCSV